MIIAKIIIVFSIAIALFCIQSGIRKWVTHLVKPELLTFSFPHVFQQAYYQELQETFKTNIIKESNQSLEELAKQHLFLTNLRAWIIPHKKMVHIAGEVRNPLLVINNTFILFDNNTLHETKLFKEWVYNHLPVITIPNFLQDTPTSLTTEEFSAIKNIPFDLLKDYFIVWNDPTDIMAYPKQKSALSIRFNTITGITPETIDHYHLLLQEYTYRTTKKKSARWIADVRFEKQIVVYADIQKRGDYGAHI